MPGEEGGGLGQRRDRNDFQVFHNRRLRRVGVGDDLSAESFLLRGRDGHRQRAFGRSCPALE
jgi:hypothetical protein